MSDPPAPTKSVAPSGPTYGVGIDLGTSRCAMAAARLGGEDAPQLIPIAQWESRGVVATSTMLPSVLFSPLDGDTSGSANSAAVADSGPPGDWSVGAEALDAVSRLPDRTVVSTKSWLCHRGIDPDAPLLPWRVGVVDEERPVLSPVDATRRILRQLAWAFERHTDCRLAEQDVVVTVPASFDAVARELTLRAARAEGLDVVLLEEPQAAFYDAWQQPSFAVTEPTLAVVVDVGGGTTDFSLMELQPEAESADPPGVMVERVAVGRHLLVGGDNMDLTLAAMTERDVAGQEAKLDTSHFRALVAECRRAKERLLGVEGADSVVVVVAARGRKLVGQTRRAELKRSTVTTTLLNAFFPLVNLDERAPVRRGGLAAFGLPYERDVAITRHLAKFVHQHTEASRRPKAILLNGGVFDSPVFARRVVDVVSHWAGAPVKELETSGRDQAVALGAARYALTLRGQGERIGGGAPRAYYLGLAPKTATVPGEVVERLALCVLPRGAAAEATQRADNHPLVLRTGEQVRFDMYAAAHGAHRAGAVVTVREAELERLSPLTAKLGDAQGKVRVAIEATLSSVGSLDVVAWETESSDPSLGRHRLAFDTNALVGREEDDAGPTRSDRASARPPRKATPRVDEAVALVQQLYARKATDVDPRAAKNIFRSLEKILGARARWDAVASRRLFDAVYARRKSRRRSAEHERAFWMLAGFGLRPGRGLAGDKERVAGLFELFDQGLSHREEARLWPQFWIAWRRVCAGLDPIAQEKIRDTLDGFLAPSDVKTKKTKKTFRNDAFGEMLELAACLENVAPKRKGALGDWILDRTFTDRDQRLWAALGKIGARLPIYGSAHLTVHAATVAQWMDHLSREKWTDVASAPPAAVSMCRVTGDRERDLDEGTRKKVHRRLIEAGFSDDRAKPVLHWVALVQTDREAFYGDTLPVGLELADG